MSRPLHYRYLGRIPYRTGWAKQQQVAQAVREGSGEWLLTMEHDPVFTIGRRGSFSDVLIDAEERTRLGIEVVEVDRGGEVTYHGPGQLVVYPIVRINPRRFGVADLVRGLADVTRRVLWRWQVEARYDPEHPGLWVGEEKIASIGMRIKGGISYHGLSLNVSPSLEAFGQIVPCGQPGVRVTSLTMQLGVRRSPPSLPEVAGPIGEMFAERFGYDLCFNLEYS